MFVSLALENMRVYMIGSLLLACASVAAIALANFLADQHTFGLLRLRGLEHFSRRCSASAKVGTGL